MFADAHLYQTWGAAAEIGGRRQMQTLQLRRAGRLVAGAIASVRTFPVQFATVYMGPMWRPIGHEADTEDFRQAVRALRNELVCRLGLSVRIAPYAWRKDEEGLSRILEEEGFRDVGELSVHQKLIMDITPGPEALMSGMGRHWRRNLRKAQRNGLEVVEGTGEEMLDEFSAIFRDYLRRKGIEDESKLERYFLAQKRLPERIKMRVLLCKAGSTTCAGLLYSCLNDNALFLQSAVTEEGQVARGTYLLHWHAIQQCKQEGAKIYDVDRIDPRGNPGSFRFKNELAGVHGRQVRTLGRFDAVADSLAYRALLLAEQVKMRSRTPYEQESAA